MIGITSISISIIDFNLVNQFKFIQQSDESTITIKFTPMISLLHHVPYRLLVDSEQIIVPFGKPDHMASYSILSGNQAGLEHQLQQFARLGIIVNLALVEIGGERGYRLFTKLINDLIEESLVFEYQ